MSKSHVVYENISGEQAIDQLLDYIEGCAEHMYSKDLASFGLNVRSAVRGLWTGDFDFMSFVDNMTSAIFKGYEQAWQEGASQCGIGVTDRTATEQQRLDREVNTDLGHVPPFADFIAANSKANGGKLGKLLTRAEMWTNRYNFVVGIAQQTSCADQKYQWRVGPTEHCRDCLTYDGRIYRGSTWAAVGAQPQSRRLECGGYRCQCALVLVTSASVRAWPGRPPAPSGG